MTEFLQSLRSDLLSRRLLPFVALLAVGLLAAVGYAVTGGSSSSSSAPVAPPRGPSVVGVASLPVVIASANPNEAVSETPGGVRVQSHGPTRDPFIPLPSPPVAKNTSTNSASSSASKSAASSAGGSSSGTGGSSGKGSGGAPKAPAPKKPTKPPFPYIVSVLFGRASSTPGQPATLTPYEDVKLPQSFPSKQNALISFEGVAASGAGAVFKLVVAPILRGAGVCLPSTSECVTIDLHVGHAEELEYIEASGQPVIYELKIVSIAKKSDGASAARAKRGATTAQARFKIKAAQGIGQASAVQALRDGSTALSARG